ncbi:MAG: glycosyltransferase family 4 protein [Sumerlaeia bacterium]
MIKPNSTGVGHFIKGILRGLDHVAAKSGTRVSVLRCPTTSEQLNEFWGSLHYCECHLVDVDPENHPWADVWLNWQINSWMKFLGGTHLFSPAFIGPLIQGNYKVVVCLHDTLCWDFPENYPAGFRRYIKTLSWLSARRAWKTVCPSHGAREQLLGHQIARPEIVSYGLDLSLFHPSARGLQNSFLHQMGTKNDPFEIVFLASFERRKNHQILFEALTISPACELNLRITLLHHATSEEVHTIQKMAGVHHVNVEVVTPKSQEAIAEAFRRSTFSVLPSLAEGFGAPALESMACGCPVILSSTNWFRLLSGEGERAYLADPYDPKDWAVAIHELLSNPHETERKRRNAFQFAQQFTWNSSAAKLLEVCFGR